MAVSKQGDRLLLEWLPLPSLLELAVKMKTYSYVWNNGNQNYLEMFNIWFGNLLQLWLLVGGKALRESWQREEEGPGGVEAVCVSQWVLPGRGDCRRWGRPELSGQAWCYVVALVFPTLPSLHSVMNGFLLVCGHGPSLKSILTKAQNTHPNQPASLCPGLWILPTASPPAADWLSLSLANRPKWKEWLNLHRETSCFPVQRPEVTRQDGKMLLWSKQRVDLSKCALSIYWRRGNIKRDNSDHLLVI